MVDVDSVTNGDSAGFTEARVDHTASGASGGDAGRGALSSRRHQARVAITLAGLSGAVVVFGDKITRPPLSLVSSTKC
jgi:hypothetical protein